MSPFTKISEIEGTGNYWDEVCDELRKQAKDWFKDQKPTVKIAVFSRSELISIINSKCGRDETTRWDKTSEYAINNVKLKDPMFISQARYDGKFNELIQKNSDFVRVNSGRRKHLGVKR